MRLMCHLYRLEWSIPEPFEVWIPISGISVENYIHKIYPPSLKTHLLYFKNCYEYQESKWQGWQLSWGWGGGGGSYPSMQNRRGDVQEGKCPFTHKISLTHLIENVHSLTMHIFKEKKKETLSIIKHSLHACI